MKMGILIKKSEKLKMPVMIGNVTGVGKFNLDLIFAGLLSNVSYSFGDLSKSRHRTSCQNRFPCKW